MSQFTQLEKNIPVAGITNLIAAINVSWHFNRHFNRTLKF